MLGTIRDKASGWIAGIIVGALIISFAFWGVSSYFGGGDVFVAKVNDSEIKYQSFQKAFYTLRQQMQSVLGGDALTLEEEEFIKEQTLQKLVDTEVVNQIIRENGLRVTNKKVVETIKNLEFFKGEEGFDRLKYERAVASMGMDPVVFEMQLRMDLLTEQLQAGLSDSLFVLDSELESILRLKSQTRDITYATLSLSSFVNNDSEIESDKIESFYNANLEKFADPEKVKIAYLELDVNELAESIETNEEDLKVYYNDNKDKYDVTEQRSITKLFVQTSVQEADDSFKEATEEEKAKAKSVIESALKMVNEGKSFEEVVGAFTEEGKGALQFSENNFLPKGVLEKEVEEFLFNSEEGAISDVIETKKGFNIVKVGEIRGGPKNVYESVSEKVASDYKKDQAELQFFELADQLTNLSYEHSDSLDIAAEAINKEVVETDFFSRESASEGLLSKPQVISNSFDAELMNSGRNSDAIELSENHIVVLRVIEHQEAKTKPLEDVRDEVIAEIRQEQAAEAIRKESDAVVKQLETGVSIDAVTVTGDVKLDWVTVEKSKRDNIEVNRSVLRDAFNAGVPSDKPIVSSNRLGSGDYSIVIVTAVHDGEVSEDDEALSNSTDIELRRTRGTNEWRQFIKNVKSNSDIQLFKENI
jgi:peptidyl-prolyl cis-trans isomerase D